MTVTPEQERNWFAAHMLVTWPKITRAVRKAYKADDDDALIEAYAVLRDVLAGWVRVIDDYTGKRYMRPQDTTVPRQFLMCSGSKKPPVKGSMRHPAHLRMATGICSNPRCGRRIKPYTTGTVARHKEGR